MATGLDQRAMQRVIGYRLRRAQLVVFKGFYEAFAELALRPAEFAVLALIADNPGRKQAEIAAVLGIKRANFVAIVNGLAERRLVERRQKENDRRSHALFLTDGGREFAIRMNEIQQQLEQRIVAQLGGPGERDKLIALLDRIDS